jgi:hypothetical protein
MPGGSAIREKPWRAGQRAKRSSDSESRGQLGECPGFTQVGQDQQARRPGFSFRQHDPIEARWPRMTPAVERFRGSPDESRTPQQIWEMLNQARDGLRSWVTVRSGVHPLRG